MLATKITPAMLLNFFAACGPCGPDQPRQSRRGRPLYRLIFYVATRWPRLMPVNVKRGSCRPAL